eukprot:TRINITY_DN11901_c0_g2_i2.p1 TRINITY_DN11901_c0_g2~~TRINITY_DN11901_c0_g2_i2.p1  ORF type:complete len:588 (-),score=69.73 TRINITY_DN11901_c0_g2_i2:73-1707(-)
MLEGFNDSLADAKVPLKRLGSFLPHLIEREGITLLNKTEARLVSNFSDMKLPWDRNQTARSLGMVEPLLSAISHSGLNEQADARFTEFGAMITQFDEHIIREIDHIRHNTHSASGLVTDAPKWIARLVIDHEELHKWLPTSFGVQIMICGTVLSLVLSFSCCLICTRRRAGQSNVRCGRCISLCGMHVCNACAMAMFLLCMLAWSTTAPLGLTCGFVDSFVSSAAVVANIASTNSKLITNNPHVSELTDSFAVDIAEICLGDKHQGDWMTGVFGNSRDWHGFAGCAFNFTLDSLDQTLRSDWTSKFGEKVLQCLGAHFGQGWIAQLPLHIKAGDIPDILNTIFPSLLNFTIPNPKQTIEKQYRALMRVINDDIIPKLVDTAHNFIVEYIEKLERPELAPTQAQMDQLEEDARLVIDALFSDAIMRSDVMAAAERLFFAMENGIANVTGETLLRLDDRVFTPANCDIALRSKVGVFDNALCGDDGIGGVTVPVVLTLALLALGFLLCAFLCCFSNVVEGIANRPTSARETDHVELLLSGGPTGLS